ncbi:hypothetical protein TraAM80_03913 [Trypanosoma rangeli]|uniref:Uncharacterized protein n=1 Tax=Trypanosoma rangeli TaxID=5698 RepID=A0A3S5IRF8_TRYRA|nr:uncharacterized protein TraAM80_03913 [Trypanosoma rangeli]RNF06459.1 hypothetical protein TraAM80_03913 [Trypanosoma rangeli]|eukprot:RNF06459.1 hypothetical protein TraAM80_03913 [Trypanosoma rangeli]
MLRGVTPRISCYHRPRGNELTSSFFFSLACFCFSFCRQAPLPPFLLHVCAQKHPDEPKELEERVTTTTTPTRRNVMETFGTSPPDADLDIASRDYAQRVQGLHNDAYRQAIGEIAGEMYGVVYTQVYRDALEGYRRDWDSSTA